MQSRNVNDAAKYHYNEGKKLNEQRKYAEAVEQYSKAIALVKGNAIFYYSRAFAHHELKKFSEAIADYKMALTIYPDFIMAKADLARAEKAAAKQYYEEGKKLKEQGKYAEAIEQFSKAIALDKTNANIYQARGYAHNELKKYSEAIADYDMVISLNPNYSIAYNNRGFAYNNLGKYTEAIADYDMAVRLIPNSSLTYNNRGTAYEQLGKYTEAIADYKKALAIDPDNAKAKNNLKSAEKAQHQHKLSLLSQRSNDNFAALNLNGMPPRAIPATLLNLMKQEDELLAALLEYTQQSDELNTDTARNITAAINQWRYYPLVACQQPTEEIPSLTPHISDFLRRKEAIYRYITEIRQALLQIKDTANTSAWEIKHWLNSKPISGTPRHIKQIRDLLASINEHSSTEAVMNAYGKILSLLPTTTKKSRLPETAAFYDSVKFDLSQIMFNPAACLPVLAKELAVEGPSLEAPPSYDEHVLREKEQLGVLMDWFPHRTIDVTADAYFLSHAGALYPVIISKLRFNEDVTEKSMRPEAHPVPLFSAAESAALAQVPASVTAAPLISSSPSSFFAPQQALRTAADAAAVDIAEALEKQLPPVPTHALPEAKSANNNAHAPAQRQMMLA